MLVLWDGLVWLDGSTLRTTTMPLKDVAQENVDKSQLQNDVIKNAGRIVKFWKFNNELSHFN